MLLSKCLGGFHESTAKPFTSVFHPEMRYVQPVPLKITLDASDNIPVSIERVEANTLRSFQRRILIVVGH
jgi:hypothetical protein